MLRNDNSPPPQKKKNQKKILVSPNPLSTIRLSHKIPPPATIGGKPFKNCLKIGIYNNL